MSCDILCKILRCVFVFVSARWHLHLQGRVSALGTTDGSWIPFEGWRSRRRGFCLRRMDEQGGSHNYCCRADHANVFLPFASVFVQCSKCISAICAFVWGGWMRVGATIFVASRSRKLIWAILGLQFSNIRSCAILKSICAIHFCFAICRASKGIFSLFGFYAVATQVAAVDDNLI